jgi:hypothetical protein
VHERGSQGWSAWKVGLGGANTALPGELVVVVDVGVFPVEPVAEGAGGLTVKSVPVTTVTCEPGDTSDGLYERITVPDIESATTWAAASSLAFIDE